MQPEAENIEKICRKDKHNKDFGVYNKGSGEDVCVRARASMYACTCVGEQV